MLVLNPEFREFDLRVHRLPGVVWDALPLKDFLEAQVALAEREPDCIEALARTHELPSTDLRLVIAREHGYRDWDDVLKEGDRIIYRDFERAADAIIDGDEEALRTLLKANPHLASQRSAHRRQATLLHHVAANGIEHCRQWQSPQNAPAIARLLLDAGADPNATCECYKSDTALTLLVSSCHPAEAGVQAPLVDVLCDGGAFVNGVDDDGAPLWTAIVWGYNQAVDRLAAHDARIDNIIFAAAVSDMEALQHRFMIDPGPIERFRVHDRPLDVKYGLEYALIYAAGLGRVPVVEYLLKRNPDLTIREPVYRITALEAASYQHAAAGRPHGNPEVIKLL